jgi:uroporphyrinogen-III synthase
MNQADRSGPILKQRTVVITRAEQKGAVLKMDLERRGARVISVPTIRFAPPVDPEPLERALDSIEDFNWLLFTSSMAVECFFKVARRREIPSSTWNRFRFGVVGATTASRLASSDVHGQEMVVAGTAIGLGNTLLGAPGSVPLCSTDRCLFPHANIARTDLQDLLREEDIPFEAVVAYETIAEAPEKAGAFLQAVKRRDSIDAIAYASPSAFTNFLAMTHPLGDQYIHDQKTPLISIGPTTTRAMLDAGHKVAREAAPHSSIGILNAICDLLCSDTTGAPGDETADSDSGAPSHEEEA